MKSEEQKPEQGWGDFAGMDRIDVLIIVLAVALSTALKYQHLLWFGEDIPNWFFNLALPFALVIGGYKIRSSIRELVEQRERAKRWPRRRTWMTTGTEARGSKSRPCETHSI